MNTTATVRYRVLATTTVGFTDPKIDTFVKWEGTDIDELSTMYPPSNIFGADPLFQTEIEDGFIITRFKFERQLEDGSWEDASDPRRRITPVTYMERIIDEENRHLFPGDYIDDDDCPGYDDYYDHHCKLCMDNGCAECVTNWCAECNDGGCAICDPTNVCPSCNNYCDPQYDSLGVNSGLCRDCEHIPSEFIETRPVCFDNCSEYADGDDGLCPGCRQYYVDLDNQLTSWWRRALRACMFWR